MPATPATANGYASDLGPISDKISRGSSGNRSKPGRGNKAPRLVLDGTEEVWCDDVHAAFMQALEKYPPIGRLRYRCSDINVKQAFGRCQLIQSYIYNMTGKTRTRKQISSHLQRLKNSHEHNPKMLAESKHGAHAPVLPGTPDVFMNPTMSSGSQSSDESDVSVATQSSFGTFNSKCSPTNMAPPEIQHYRFHDLSYESSPPTSGYSTPALSIGSADGHFHDDTFLLKLETQENVPALYRYMSPVPLIPIECQPFTPLDQILHTPVFPPGILPQDKRRISPRTDDSNYGWQSTRDAHVPDEFRTSYVAPGEHSLDSLSDERGCGRADELSPLTHSGEIAARMSLFETPLQYHAQSQSQHASPSLLPQLPRRLSYSRPAMARRPLTFEHVSQSGSVLSPHLSFYSSTGDHLASPADIKSSNPPYVFLDNAGNEIASK